MQVPDAQILSPDGLAASQCPLCGGPGEVLEPALTDLFFDYPGQWRYDRCTRADCAIAWNAEPLAPAALADAYGRYYTHDAGPPTRSEIAIGRWIAAGFTRRGDRFAAMPFLFREAENHVLDGGALPPRGDGLALDLGCGGGERLDYLRAIGWGRTMGVERDPVAVAHARAAGRDVRQGSAEAIPLGDSEADAVFLHHVVEHLEDLGAALAEVRRVLRPGGSVVITTPNLDAAGRRQWGPFWRGYEAPRHLRLYTLAALRRMLCAAGLTVTIARTSVRAAPFMNRASARVAPPTIPRPSTNWWYEDRTMIRAERRRRRGHEDGEELFTVARLEESA